MGVHTKVTHLFGDMTPRIESHMRKNNKRNTVGPNEFTDFEKFEVEHPENTKTILATNSPNHPGDGITLRQNRSSSHIMMCKASAANNEIRVSEEKSKNLMISD